MKPQFVIAVYQAKPGKEQALRNVIARHIPTLREQELLSERPTTVLNAGGGFYLELIEWKSPEAAARAHENAEVGKIWGEFAEVCDFRSLSDLPAEQSRKAFPAFSAVVPNVNPRQGMTYSDNMIGAKDFPALVKFYAESFGLYQANEDGKGYAMLVDPITAQKLCITDGASVSRMAPGISTGDLSASLKLLEARGAKVLKNWEYPRMKGANLQDPEGNEILVWQEKEKV